METSRLRKLQAPSVATALLESLVSNLNRRHRGARRITDRSELPMALQRLAVRVSKEDNAWAAWVLDDRISFCTGEMSLDLSREHGHPVLKVTNYEEGGRIQKYGLWARTANGEWQSQSL